jgi:nitrate/nitrite transport system substrate-binding protein
MEKPFSPKAPLESNPIAIDDGKRDFLKKAAGMSAAAAIMSLVPPGVRSAAWAAGSDAPEKTEIRIGFIPLTDCASVVMAAEKGFDKKYGIKIIPTKEASWAGVRDKLTNGELDAAHVLYGLIYGLQLGVGGQKKDMAVLMSLNNNGQAITLNNQLKAKGVVDGAGLAKLVKAEPKEWTFAQTFPTGTHAMWLYYWMGAYGIDPFRDVKVITVPPPQMVANMRVDKMDGYCVGEPWNARAIHDKIGFTATTTQDIWTDHPEKVLGTTLEFIQKYPNTARAMIAAILDASKYIDTMSNRSETAGIIAAEVLRQHRRGCHRRPHARRVRQRHRQEVAGQELHEVLQRRQGQLPLPVRRHVVPDPAQALGPAEGAPGLPGGSQTVNQIKLYKEAAAMTKTPVPKSDMRSHKLIDGVVWDGRNPKAYADGFKVKA